MWLPLFLILFLGITNATKAAASRQEKSLAPIKRAVHDLMKGYYSIEANRDRNLDVASAIDILRFSLNESKIFQSESAEKLGQNIIVLKEMLLGSKIFVKVFPQEPVNRLFKTVLRRIANDDAFNGVLLKETGGFLEGIFEVILLRTKYYNIQRAINNLAKNKSTFQVKPGQTGYDYIHEIVENSMICQMPVSDEQYQSNVVRQTLKYISRLAHAFWIVPVTENQAEDFFELVRCQSRQGHSKEAIQRITRQFLSKFSKTDLSHMLNRLASFVQGNERFSQILKRFLQLYSDDMQFGLDTFLLSLKMINKIVRRSSKGRNNLDFLCELFENSLFPEESSFGGFVENAARQLLPDLLANVEGENADERTVKAGNIFLNMLALPRLKADHYDQPFVAYSLKHKPELLELIPECRACLFRMKELDPDRNISNLYEELTAFGPAVIGLIIHQMTLAEHKWLEILIVFRLAHFKASCADIEWVTQLVHDPLAR